MTPTPGLRVGGKYDLVRLLARGGMGSVWVAQHQRLDALVAVKFMDPGLAGSPEARARFEREAKAAAKLRSPHVVQVLDYGVEGDTPFIVMELLEGEDLRARLKRCGRLELEACAVILKHACKALRLAAEAGIVHRDLKPGNLFLARSGDDEIVKVLDFGVAKAVRAAAGENTSTGTLLGSPHYMSPEQARGLELDPRSDLFSIGVILFQMVTGERPFSGKDVGDVIVKICTEPLPTATAFRAELPPEVDQFFERALARNPAKRFQSAQAMASEFAAIVSRQLGAALPESSQSGSTRLPRPPELGALDPADPGAAAALSAEPAAASSDVPTVTAPGPMRAPAVADEEATAATPSGTLRSGVAIRPVPLGDADRRARDAAGGQSERARSRGIPLWAAMAALLLGGGLVYALVGRSPSPAGDGPSAASAGAAGHGAERRATGSPSPPSATVLTADLRTAAPDASSAPSATAPAVAASPTTSSRATTGPPVPPPRPGAPPKPTASPAAGPKPTGKHPIFGI